MFTTTGTHQHSPGPWVEVDGRVVSQPIDQIVPVTMKDGEIRQHHTGLVALVYGHHVGEYPDRAYTLDANVRLIAAAPDLVRVMTDLCRAMETGWIPPDDRDDVASGGAVARAWRAGRDSGAYGEARALLARIGGA